MESKIKLLLSRFLNKDVSAINGQTVVDRTSLKSSIMVHRFYAELAKNGTVIEDYLSIHTFNDLMNRLHLKENETHVSENPEKEMIELEDESSIGIDIENTDNLPICIDYREDPFYKMNFSPREISYCLIQSDPRLSFTGLFAAKEAIVKTSRRYHAKPFNQIEIDHDPSGRPIFPLFNISISRKDNFAIAVAARQVEEKLIELSESNKKLSEELRQVHDQLLKSEVYRKKSIFGLTFVLLLIVGIMVYLASR